jgi:mono/diheme cytochrome c family protein
MVMAFLPSCQNNSTVNNSSPVPVSGKELFEQNCARCHGEEGNAGINNATNLQLSRADTISIIHLVQQGRKDMPSFEGVIKDSDIHKIAIYVFTLRK